MRRLAWSLCAVCRRQSRGYGWFDARYPVHSAKRDQTYVQLCSRVCQDLYHGRRGVIDPTPNEQAAIAHGGVLAGEYLESLGKSDLASLSLEEWNAFLEVIVTGYCEHLRALAARDCERLAGQREELPF